MDCGYTEIVLFGIEHNYGTAYSPVSYADVVSNDILLLF